MTAQSRPAGRNTPRPSTDTGETADGRTGPRIGSLFSGAGGLDMAVAEVFGGEVAWFAEIDKAASKVLAHHYPNVPNLGDITAVDWVDVPSVDVLCGGFPCQDVSAAGKRAGIKDGTRSGLWSVFAEAIDALRPQWVVIENVRGLLSATAHRTVEDDESGDMESPTAALGNGAGRPVLRAAGAVLGDLATRGYDAQWTTLAASAVGAPHRRERVFILATDTSRSGDRTYTGSVRRLGYEAEGQRIQREWSGDVVGSRGATDVAVSRDGDVALLPTPRSLDSTGVRGRTPNRSDEANHRAGRTLTDEVMQMARDGDVALLPTPNAEVERGSRTPEGIARRIAKGDKQYSLEDAAIMLSANTVSRDGDVALLPTPNASDGSGGGQHPDKREGHSRQLIDYVLALGEESNATSEGRPGKELRDMRDTTDPQTVCERTPRGSQRVPEAVPLLPSVCEQPTSCTAEHPRVASEACNPSGELRGMRDNGKAARSPQGPQPGQQRPCEPCGAVRELPSEAALAGGSGLSGATHSGVSWGKYEPAIRRWERVLGRPAPAPTEPNKNGNPRLAAEFSSWLMGWPAGWVTDPAIGISRNDQLRIVGNGVCSQQAVAALGFLLGVATGTHTHTQRERADVTALLPTPRASDPSNATSHSSPGFRPQLGEVVRTLAAPNGNGATG